MSYVAEPLGDHHDLSSFDSGNNELDDWLRLHAWTSRGQGTRTYVVVNESGSVLGYFAIAPHTIDRGELSKAQGRGAPRQIPAVLLAKLALDRRLQGQGLGSELLVVAEHDHRRGQGRGRQVRGGGRHRRVGGQVLRAPRVRGHT